MIEETLRSLLLASEGVTTLVVSRIYHVKMPQSPTLPAVTIQLIGDERDYDLQGDTGERTATYQITAWAAQPLDARSVAGAVISALSGYTGTTDGIEFMSLTEANRIHGYDEATSAHQENVDFDIVFKEA